MPCRPSSGDQVHLTDLDTTLVAIAMAAAESLIPSVLDVQHGRLRDAIARHEHSPRSLSSTRRPRSVSAVSDASCTKPSRGFRGW